MNTVSVSDSIIIHKSKEEIFQAITTDLLLAKWWAKSAESDPQLGGTIVFHWFNGSTLHTKYSTFILNEEVSFGFGKEFVTFTLGFNDSGVNVRVVHSLIDAHDIEGIIHIAQSWKFLLMNLKLFLEYDLDFRNNE